MTQLIWQMWPDTPARAKMLRLTFGTAALAALSACGQPFDLDLRGAGGGFTTANAAQNATTARPEPDDRGIISYPTYQVAVARRGDTLNTLAVRIGADANQLGKFNGIPVETLLRSGEIIALPTRVAEPSAATGAVDIAAIAGTAIDSSESSTIQTQTLQPTASSTVKKAPKAKAPTTKEPVRHKVRRGETGYTIARLYNVPVQSLAEWNGLDSDFAIREGQYLLIPVARQAAPQKAAVPAPGVGSPTPTPPSSTKPLPKDNPKPAAAAAPAPKIDVGKTTSATATAALGYPVQGSIIRAYSKGKNEGINIKGKAGDPVKSAADGTVAAITSDANQVPIIVVRHADNLLTVYANIADISVKKGDKVSRGQTIAKLRTGKDSYVHFEVRKGFDSVDPIPYLQ